MVWLQVTDPPQALAARTRDIGSRCEVQMRPPVQHIQAIAMKVLSRDARFCVRDIYATVLAQRDQDAFVLILATRILCNLRASDTGRS